MSRPLRIEYSGALYHVTSRGDGREAIYGSDEDRRAWLRILAHVCKRFRWRCHSWCQMGNHYHLVIETIEGNLAQGMRQLNGVYTQYVNRTYGRVGHVFQGRYKAVLVQKESHLLELTRYVVLNPVRAHMVDEPGQWPWSAYGAFIGREPPSPWLETDGLLGQFGRDRATAISRFIDYVRAGIGLPSIWEGLRGQIYLGDEDFVAHMQAQAQTQPEARPSLAEVPRMQRRPPAPPLAEFVAQSADQPKTGMARAYASGGYTLQQIAQAFGVHYSTVSRAIRS